MAAAPPDGAVGAVCGPAEGRVGVPACEGEAVGGNVGEVGDEAVDEVIDEVGEGVAGGVR
ncbi:hypothetical protein [Sinosporangium album]|uniref:hypothetical protein n=1 Tax=Sinosporangium album TaxID=504805 RepID=UPI00115FC1F1|nr:hypothetical protein [Sinosporangium album]